MSELVASIFHLTDMHLYVDESGAMREQQPLFSARFLAAVAAAVPSHRVRGVCAGILWHDDEALASLREDFLSAVRDERETYHDVPIVVLQTGDVEALGSAAPASVVGYDACPSFAFVHGELRDRAAANLWVDLYGNHSTFPGTFPPLRVRKRSINRERIATVPGLEGRWPDAVTTASGTTGIPVTVVRLNSVSRTLLEETRASGRVGDHPPEGRDTDAVIEDLKTLLAPHQGRAIRIVVMHHPPHSFGAAIEDELAAGSLEGASELAQALSELRVQLVIAGHRHELDPGRDATSLVSSRQPPLAPPAVQLVAEGPTQDTVARPDDPRNYEALQKRSFCRYRLWSDGQTFDVERAVFDYTDGSGQFSIRRSSTIFEGLPLK